MKYQNNKTGVVIETDCIIKGGDWAVLEQPKTTKKATRKKTATTKGDK